MHKRAVDQLGRIVLPQTVRRRLKIETGDLLAVTVKDGKILLEKVWQGKTPPRGKRSNVTF